MGGRSLLIPMLLTPRYALNLSRERAWAWSETPVRPGQLGESGARRWVDGVVEDGEVVVDGLSSLQAWDGR